MSPQRRTERGVCTPAEHHGPTAMQKLRIATLGISGGRSLTRPFRDARRSPSTRKSPVPRATRTPRKLGFVHRLKTILCRPAPNPNITIRNFFNDVCCCFPELVLVQSFQTTNDWLESERRLGCFAERQHNTFPGHLERTLVRLRLRLRLGTACGRRVRTLPAEEVTPVPACEVLAAARGAAEAPRCSPDEPASAASSARRPASAVQSPPGPALQPPPPPPPPPRSTRSPRCSHTHRTGHVSAPSCKKTPPAPKEAYPPPAYMHLAQPRSAHAPRNRRGLQGGGCRRRLRARRT
jgi:hypothetical protein